MENCYRSLIILIILIIRIIKVFIEAHDGTIMFTKEHV